MKITPDNPDLDKLFAEMREEEIVHVRRTVEAQATHCKGFSGDITLCAVLCDGMACGDFAHDTCTGFGVWPCKNMCPTLIKCRGFSGDGGGCKPFEVVQAM